MPDEHAMHRPIGWWLKEADASLDAAFDRRLEGRGVGRRGWQVLASLARQPASRSEIADSLAAFDPPDQVEAVVEDVIGRGWVEASDGLLHLTADGQREHAVLAPRVEEVRRQVATALPQDDYAILVRLLARLVDALR